MKRYGYICLWFLFFFGYSSAMGAADQWGTGSLMIIVERENSSVVVVDSLKHEILGRISDLGVLHHASISFSQDARYAYIISRDGWLSKLDLLTLERVAKVKVGDSSIGLTVTQDNRYIAVSNYKPAVVKIIDAETFEDVAAIPVEREVNGETVPSRVVGMVDAPGNLLVFSLMDADGIWVVDAGSSDFPVIKKYWDIGKMPYDALLTPDGRYYIAGLYHSRHLAMLDLWELDKTKEIDLNNPNKKTAKMAVRKVPHLGGWSMAGGLFFAPVVAEARLPVYRSGSFELIKSISLAGMPMFAMASPDGRHVWVNFSGQNHRLVQVIDVATLEVVKTFDIGDRVFNMEFSPKGAYVYISSYKDNKVVVIAANKLQIIKKFDVNTPSGIFSTIRAHISGL
ncbi:cytochrome D1 domain-containing protein [Desulfotignum phosphitoxidans]|uniref:Cytochrome d1 biosynthesis protein NirF n=1 Tax=Desulfotignum phosphitoxidans DSM 13687 TaxID=1286635 RepID=S0FVT5_9BACT|nr:cytochrome D1 domain-containing protein [Desulfotignum phosphitoxidans]EMS77229.1 cytochrome d1 biosynthesis protein NirF [Desulfotignum phosphitoxidans DSM 13687]